MAFALGSSSSWKDSIKAQFKARDDSQTQPFRELVANCNFNFFLAIFSFLLLTKFIAQMASCYERTKTFESDFSHRQAHPLLHLQNLQLLGMY